MGDRVTLPVGMRQSLREHLLQHTDEPSDGSDLQPVSKAKTLATADLASEAAHKLADKVIGGLHSTQVRLLQQTEGRHAIYSGGEPERRLSAQGSALPVPGAPQEGKPSPGRPSPGRHMQRRLSDNLKRPRRPSWVSMANTGIKKAGRHRPEEGNKTLMTRLNNQVHERLAYMGIDWYEVQERQKRLSWLFLIENLYFWCYAGYIVSAIFVGAFLLWALEPEGKLSFAQSVYSAAACVSQSGLAVVDWSTQAASTHVISFLLILSGSASLLHMAPVLLRRKSFRMQSRLTLGLKEFGERVTSPASMHLPRHSKKLRKINSDPCLYEDTGTPSSRKVAAEPSPRPRRFSLEQTPSGRHPREFQRCNSPATLGEDTPKSGPDSPVHSHPVREVTRRQGKHISDALSDRHRLEYKALGKVLKIMAGYWLSVHVLGWLIFFAYFHFGHGKIQEKFREEGLRSHWHAAYLTVSAFQNNGLVMTPSSVMDFRWSPILLNTIGALVLLGNTLLPVAVRAIAWWLSRRAPANSEQQRVWDFLLEHPRRCFTHMFPAVHTLWLLLVVVFINLFQTLVMFWQDSDGHAFVWWDEEHQVEQQLGLADVLWNCLFQAMSTRTAGLNSINIADLSQGTTFLMVVLMYFSTTPTVVTMRHSQAGRAGELDITGRAEGVDEDVLLGENSLKSQARRYLTQDITYLVFILFLICVFEKEQFAMSAKEVTPDSDGIYGDFGFFKVLFELVSAYGTCGFSLGYRNQTCSFSGTWSAPSQYLLVFVMILGRLRGLPDSIDPSVKVAMGTGELAEHAFLHA